MKKILLFIFIILSCILNVYAENIYEYSDINNSIDVSTDNFIYTNISYSNSIDSLGNHFFNINNIHNVSNRKVPISISIGMFDINRKNIGTIVYCSSSDYDSDYSGVLLNKNESRSVKISIKSKYFIEGKNINDLKGFSILNDNSNCDSAGFFKYKDLTIEEIKNGKVAIVSKKDNKGIDYNTIINYIKKYIPNIKLNRDNMIFITIILVIYFIICTLLAFLYRKMFEREIGCVVYIPILSNFYSAQMALGKLFAYIYLIFIIIGLILKSKILIIIGLIIFIILFIINIYKMISKKYNFLYFKVFKDEKENNNIHSNKFINNEIKEEIIEKEVDNKENVDDDLIDEVINNEDEDESDLTKLFK